MVAGPCERIQLNELRPLALEPRPHRLLITPHTSFFSEEGFADCRRSAAEEALRVLAGQRPRFQVFH